MTLPARPRGWNSRPYFCPVGKMGVSRRTGLMETSGLKLEEAAPACYVGINAGGALHDLICGPIARVRAVASAMPVAVY